MTSLNHPNVVEFICSDQESNRQAIVMEYMPMNLQYFIEQCVPSRDTGFPFSRLAALDMISQIACAMEYLHGKQLVRRDLKPNNILVSPIITIPELSADGYGKVKFCDFGLAKSIVTLQSEQHSQICGVRSWRAPEASPEKDNPMPRKYCAKKVDV
jgi:serine/threonine protein kinase